MSGTDLSLWSATDLIKGFARKIVSPVEATQAALARIDALNGALNAYRLVDHDAALAAAKASEARWAKAEPLGLVDGVPTSIKDISLTEGWSTLRGSKAVSEDGPWTEDAPVVARLREHGAVLLGKTTTPEYGWKGVTDSPLTGITRNPWDPSKTPGGSSGGAAVAAATGMGALHQGSDGGGSIRMPAGYTGIYGIKPTFGRVPAYPLSPFGTVAHIGPMTRTVADSALMLSVMSEPDARDWYASPYDGADFRTSLRHSVAGWRVAYCPDLGGAEVQAEVLALVDKAVRVFTELGAVVERVESPLPNSHETFTVHWFAGAANLMQAFSPDQRAMMDPGLIEVAETGARYTLMEYFAAVKARESMGTAMNLFHESYDILLTPTLPQPAFEAGEEVPVGSNMARWTEWTPFSYPFNLTQQPAASIPCGRTEAGLPVGLQIVGPKGGDDLVLTASAAFESVMPVELPPLAPLS